jgi:hypothetical protein
VSARVAAAGADRGAKVITKFRPAHEMTPYNRPVQKRNAYKYGLLCVHRVGKGSPPVWAISHRPTGKTLGVYAYRSRHLMDIARSLSLDPVWRDPLADQDWAVFTTQRAVHHYGGCKVFTTGRVSQ